MSLNIIISVMFPRSFVEFYQFVHPNALALSTMKIFGKFYLLLYLHFYLYKEGNLFN